MNYYQRHIGDYHKKAGRLSMLEHGAYTLLLDACYDREKFPTKEEAIDWCWARSAEEIAAVEFVLSKFFTLDGSVYVQTTIQENVAHYHEKALKNKQIAIEREEARRMKREQAVHESARTVHESPPNHKPITNNQEPVIKPKTHRGTRLPADMILSDDWALFCKKERPELTPSEVFSEFKDYWIAQPGQKGVKTDWDATWRNWVRRQNAKKKGSVWDENERRKQQLADRIFGKRSTDDGRTIEAATVRLG